MNLEICKKCEKHCDCWIFARNADGRKYAHVFHNKAVKDMNDKKEAWGNGVFFGVFIGLSDFIVSQEYGILRRRIGYAKYNGLPPYGKLSELEWKRISDKEWGLDEYPPDRDSQDTCVYYAEQMISSLLGGVE